MTGADLLDALELPAASRVDRRVPKTLLTEHGAPTAADRRKINDDVETLTWVAALKPATIGVPEHRDAVREYLEIAVMQLTVRGAARASAADARLRELVHGAVPYPVILLADDTAGRWVEISAAHKRRSHAEKAATVLDEDVIAVSWPSAERELSADERGVLRLTSQPAASMHSLYQGWIDAIVSCRAARLSGRVTAPGAGRSSDRIAALVECEAMDVELTRVRAAAAKERQMARRVELNETLKRLEAQRVDVIRRLL